MSNARFAVAIGTLLLLAAPVAAKPIPVVTQDAVTSGELQSLMDRLSTLLTELRGLQNQIAGLEARSPRPGGLNKVLYKAQLSVHQAALKSLQLRVDQLMLEIQGIEARINEIRSLAVPLALRSKVADAGELLGDTKQQAFKATTQSVSSLIVTAQKKKVDALLNSLSKSKRAEVKARSVELEQEINKLLSARDEIKQAAITQNILSIVSGGVSVMSGASSVTASSSVGVMTKNVGATQDQKLNQMAQRMQKRDKGQNQLASGKQSLQQAKAQLEDDPSKAVEATWWTVKRGSLASQSVTGQIKSADQATKMMQAVSAQEKGLEADAKVDQIKYESMVSQARSANKLMSSMLTEMIATADRTLTQASR